MKKFLAFAGCFAFLAFAVIAPVQALTIFENVEFPTVASPYGDDITALALSVDDRSPIATTGMTLLKNMNTHPLGLIVAGPIQGASFDRLTAYVGYLEVGWPVTSS